MTARAPGDLTAALQGFGLARDQMRAVLAGQAGISATDLDALEHLEAHGPLTQRDLGRRLSLTSGAVTMLVDRLEAGGWARRRPHPDDRRYLLVELAPSALERTPPALTAFHAQVRALAAKVPLAHRQAVWDFLTSAAELASSTAEGLSGPAAPPRPAPPA